VSEVHHVSDEDEIDMALLTNLETPCKLAFVGGEETKQFSVRYGGVWIADSATVETDLLRFWGALPND
jgi:hypothetical protein